MTHKPRILFAVDDSEYAPNVAEEAARIAAQRGADVVILSVVTVSSLASDGEIDPQSISEEEKGLQSLHEKLISKYFYGTWNAARVEGPVW